MDNKDPYIKIKFTLFYFSRNQINLYGLLISLKCFKDKKNSCFIFAYS